MQFNLGQVWKLVEAGDGEPRRAVVIAIEDDGRRGTLFFDNGDEQSFLWAELTQAGKWQVDTSPKPTRSADDLKQLILQEIRRHPVCPAGMSIEVRHTSGDDWEALAVPPPGQQIAYADCAFPPAQGIAAASPAGAHRWASKGHWRAAQSRSLCALMCARTLYFTATSAAD